MNLTAENSIFLFQPLKKIIKTWLMEPEKLVDKVSNSWELVIDKLLGWYNNFISMLPNFVIAVLVLITFYLFSKLVRKILNRTLSTVSKNESVNRLIISITHFVIITIGFFIALSVLQLDKAVTSLLAGVGVVGLAIGLAFQDAAANLFGGILLAMKSPINVGDLVEFQDNLGTVKHIGLRTTTILTPQGQDVVIPNKVVIENIYKHYTINNRRRIDLPVGVSYGEDLEKVERVTLEAVKNVPAVENTDMVKLFYTKFDNSSINFIVIFWIEFKELGEFYQAQSDAIKNIKKAYNENNITIPFPITTVDFGIKGGEKLHENLIAFKRAEQKL